MNRSSNKSPSWAHLVFTDLPTTPLIAKTYDWSSEWAVPLTASHICFCRSLDRTSDVEQFLCKISGSTFRVDKVSKDLSEALHNSPADPYIGEVIIRWWKSRRPSYCWGVCFRTIEAIDVNYFAWMAWISPLTNATRQRRCRKFFCVHLQCPALSIVRWQKQHILESGRPQDDRHHSFCFFSCGWRQDAPWQELSGSAGTKNATLPVWGALHANSNLIQDVFYICYIKIMLAAIWTPLSLGRALVLPAEHRNSSNFSRGRWTIYLRAAGWSLVENSAVIMLANHWTKRFLLQILIPAQNQFLQINDLRKNRSLLQIHRSWSRSLLQII